jgi:hypothetical protein
MIFIENNFVSNNDCDYLIDLYRKNQSLSFQYAHTRPLSLPELNDKIVNDLIDKIRCFAENIEKCSLIVDTAQIVNWPVGAYMERHLDPATDVFAGLIYLNDNYLGGNTGFIDREIKPEKGKFVIFYNSMLEHWVTEVEINERFVLAVWLVK